MQVCSTRCLPVRGSAEQPTCLNLDYAGSTLSDQFDWNLPSSTDVLGLVRCF